MLVVILGSNPIVTSRGLLCQREVALICLEGVSSVALAGAMSAECLIVLLSSRLLMGSPVCIKATARSLIGSRSHNAGIGRFALFWQNTLFGIPLSFSNSAINGFLSLGFVNWSSGAVAQVEVHQRPL